MKKDIYVFALNIILILSLTAGLTAAAPHIAGRLGFFSRTVAMAFSPVYIADGISKNIVVAHDMESTKLSSGSYNTSVFSEQELKTLNDVLAIIQPMSTQEIIGKSHKEDAWLRYRDGNQLIPYSEAFSLRLV